MVRGGPAGGSPLSPQGRAAAPRETAASRAAGTGVAAAPPSTRLGYPSLVMACLPRWWWQGLFVLVAGGLVYMHGIDPSPTMALAGVASAPTENWGHGTGADDSEGGHPHDAPGMHVAALCLAVLASTAAVRLARRPVRRLHRPAVLSVWVGPSRRVAAALRGPPALGPPHLAVARC